MSVKRRLAVIADNLAGGAARLAEALLAEAVESQDLEDILVYHSGNLRLPKKPPLREFQTQRHAFFLREHWRRTLWTVRTCNAEDVLNLTNFPLWTVFFPNKKFLELVLVHQPYVLAKPPYFSHPENLQEKVIRCVRKWFFNLCVILSSRNTCFLAQTKWIKSLLLQRIGDRGRVFLTPKHSGALIRYEQCSGAGSNMRPHVESPFWLYPAAFYRHKNHHALLAIGKLLLAQKKPVKIVITLNGQDLEVKRLMAMITACGLEDIIQNIGWVSSATVASLLQEACGLLFLSSFESLGLPIVEALNLGKPILAADIPTTRELAGNRALYYDLRRINDLEKLANDLVKDPKELGLGAGEQVEDQQSLPHWGQGESSALLHAYYLAHVRQV